MSIVYTADVFCDGEDCGQWATGVSGSLPPKKSLTRRESDTRGWLLGVNGNDYCPVCRKKYEHQTQTREA